MYDPEMMGNAIVVFKSSKAGIDVVIDRNQVLMTLGDPMESRNEWFEFSNVLKYFAPSLESAYVFTEKTVENTWDEVIETQLDRLALILRQYCEPILRGDLSMKEEIKKIQENRKAESLAKLRRK
jgi:hypothetical protein